MINFHTIEKFSCNPKKINYKVIIIYYTKTINYLYKTLEIVMNILTYGTFDFFHYGHFLLLKRAASLGERLIVGLSTDEFNENKNKKSILNYEQRKCVIESLKFVDLTIKENSWEQKVDDIKKYNVDILVMGSDWCGKFDYLKSYCDVIYLQRTPKISTSLIKGIL